MDPWGGVVVSVQRTDDHIDEDRFIGIRYDAAGVRHDLTREPSWLSVQPVAVADSGSVVGTVTGPDRLRRVVIRRGPGSGAMTRLSAPGRVATGFTADGDWYDDAQSGFSTAQVHPHGGAPAQRLAALDGQIVRNGPRLQGTSYDRAWGVGNDATSVTVGG
ncbi:MAG: hypothetical protein M3Y71_10085 [Actinomycetota bacterium]|nr:hypothetical protein [Actinomycetota bacterium]